MLQLENAIILFHLCVFFFLSFPFFLLHFSVPFGFVFLFVFLFLSVSFHSGRPPKYSTTTTTTSSTAVPELGCNPLLSPTSSLPASPALERPDMGGFPLSVHPHSVPQPSPSSGDVSSHLPSLGDHVVDSPHFYYCSSRVLYITSCPYPPNPPLHSSCTPQCVPEQGNSCLLDSCIHPGKRKTDLLALSFMCLFVVFVEMEPAVLQSEQSFSTFHTNIRPEVIKYSV